MFPTCRDCARPQIESYRWQPPTTKPCRSEAIKTNAYTSSSQPNRSYTRSKYPTQAAAQVQIPLDTYCHFVISSCAKQKALAISLLSLSAQRHSPSSRPVSNPKIQASPSSAAFDALSICSSRTTESSFAPSSCQNSHAYHATATKSSAHLIVSPSVHLDFHPSTTRPNCIFTSSRWTPRIVNILRQAFHPSSRETGVGNGHG